MLLSHRGDGGGTLNLNDLLLSLSHSFEAVAAVTPSLARLRTTLAAPPLPPPAPAAAPPTAVVDGVGPGVAARMRSTW